MWLDINNYIQTDNISELIFTKFAFHAKHIVIAKCKAPGPMAVINMIK